MNPYEDDDDEREVFANIVQGFVVSVIFKRLYVVSWSFHLNENAQDR